MIRTARVRARRLAGRAKRRVLRTHTTAGVADPGLYREVSTQSTPELLSLMRHDSHRIEKAVYNEILEAKQDVYRLKHEFLTGIYGVLQARGVPEDEPTLQWSKRIHAAFDRLEQEFVLANSTEPWHYERDEAAPFIGFLRNRRSVRVWSDEQPSAADLAGVAEAMIDAARWAPTSGNRQPWRFRVMIDQADKDLLEGIKEKHCVSAPLLVFVGMDTRVYGALGHGERGIYIDSGAAIMQMILLAHRCGLGTCWNHFADDLISSREINGQIYARFVKRMGIEPHVAPIAIIAVGAPKYVPPEPARMEVEDLVIPAPPTVDGSATNT